MKERKSTLVADKFCITAEEVSLEEGIQQSRTFQLDSTRALF